MEMITVMTIITEIIVVKIITNMKVIKTNAYDFLDKYVFGWNDTESKLINLIMLIWNYFQLFQSYK